jgi:acyl-CoA thioesterase
MVRMTMPTDPLRQFFVDDQFARHCGIELLSAGAGKAKAQMRLGPQHLNGFRIPQGGAIFTLADFAFAAAANSHGTVAVAANASVTFFKAAKGGVLQAEAREVSRGLKLGTYQVEVHDEQGELVALFQGLAYRKSERIEDWYRRQDADCRAAEGERRGV